MSTSLDQLKATGTVSRSSPAPPLELWSTIETFTVLTAKTMNTTLEHMG